MGRTFQYIKNEDVLKSFSELKDGVLNDRAVVIARRGDYAVFLKKEDEFVLGLSVENTDRKTLISYRTYNTNETTEALVSRGVRHACQKIAELSDEDVNRRRLQIWKWYLLDWQRENNVDTGELVKQELTWSDDLPEIADKMDMESFLHGDYLNLGNTLSLIEKYLADDPEHMEKFKTFAINDIMEMTGEDTRDRSIAENENRGVEEDLKKHTYKFTVSVDATDREHARAALLNYLAGDDRIKVQK